MLLKNLSANANSNSPKTTLNSLSHPPDLGRLFKNFGNMAKPVNTTAKGIEKAIIPSTGRITSLPLEAKIRSEPAMGAVHENETTTSVRAMKKIPIRPPLSACLSTLFTNELGKTISNNPKNDNPNKINTTKKMALGAQWVLIKLAACAPPMRDTGLYSTIFKTSNFNIFNLKS